MGGINTYGYVGASPISRSDFFGQDYWIEGSVQGEGGHPYHRSVCVGKYSGPRACISFGVDESDCYMGCKGTVNLDDSAVGPIVDKTYYRTSPETDRQIGRLFDSLNGTDGRYWLIGNNCRTFSKNVWNYLFLTFRGAAGGPR